MQQILVDSSFLFALFNVDDIDHYRVRRFIGVFTATLLLPEVALTEVAYLLNRVGGAKVAAAFMRDITLSKIERISLTSPDLVRAAEIKEKYVAADFDFVDCCIMSLSERLKITKICTFDRRDFSIFRPIHCEYLELIP